MDTKRTPEDITKEYSINCQKLGHAVYQMECSLDEIAELKKVLRLLNQEHSALIAAQPKETPPNA